MPAPVNGEPSVAVNVRRRLSEEIELAEQRLRRLEADRLSGEPFRLPDDELDLAMELSERDTHNGELERLRARIRELRQAERRLERQEQPRCEDCELPIPPARLLAVPAATTCRDCQTKREPHLRRRPQPYHASGSR